MAQGLSFVVTFILKALPLRVWLTSEMLVQPASGNCPRAIALNCNGYESRVWISTLCTWALAVRSVGLVRVGSADTQQLPVVLSGQITRHQVALMLTPVTFVICPPAIYPTTLNWLLGPLYMITSP